MFVEFGRRLSRTVDTPATRSTPGNWATPLRKSLPELQPLCGLLILRRRQRDSRRQDARWPGIRSAYRAARQSCAAAGLRRPAASTRAPAAATTRPSRTRARPPCSSTVRPPSLRVPATSARATRHSGAPPISNAVSSVRTAPTATIVQSISTADKRGICGGAADDDQVDDPDRQQQSRQRAGTGQHERLGQPFARQPPPSGAERGARRGVAFPRSSPARGTGSTRSRRQSAAPAAPRPAAATAAGAPRPPCRRGRASPACWSRARCRERGILRVLDRRPSAPVPSSMRHAGAQASR